ncbi:MAG TPA: phasin family protein [Pseudomonadales bacterium]|nr:phasin family protein [Pseudomonadales bacterium]
MADKQTKTESTNAWPNFDVGEMLKQVQIPGVDVGKLIESQRDNIKALQEANQTAVQGWQNLMTRQTEQMREALETWQTAVSDTLKSPPAEMAQKQIEHGQKAFEKALSNMRELAEMAIKSQTEAAEVIRKRFEAGLRDIQNR